jgi:hypothetical protein
MQTGYNTGARDGGGIGPDTLASPHRDKTVNGKNISAVLPGDEK